LEKTVEKAEGIFVFATAFGTWCGTHPTSFSFEPRGSFLVYKVDHLHRVWRFADALPHCFHGPMHGEFTVT